MWIWLVVGGNPNIYKYSNIKISMAFGPSGLGPGFDISGLGIRLSVNELEREQAQLTDVMAAERRDILQRIERGLPITPKEQRAYGLHIKIHLYDNVSENHSLMIY